MKKLFLLTVVITFLCHLSYAQQGKDGAKVISVNNTILNEYTSLTADAASGSTSITVLNNNLNTNGRFSTALSKGDLLMIIQMQGTTIQGTPTDSTWGAVTNYNNCGRYELVQVAGVSGTTIINICPLQNSYTSSGKVQVVRVPRYTSLSIDNNDTLTCAPWNGSSGGVLALEMSGNTVVNTGGAISATAKGFRGGALVNQPNGPDSSTIFVSTNNNGTFSYAAAKGESIAGYETDYNVYGGMYGRGAPANGGGGGDVWDAAGGGGANAGNINLWTGNGNPDITTSANYTTAWNLEYNGFASSTSSGGGRGGYATSSNFADPLTVGPNNSDWSFGYYRENVGGKGGRPLDYSTGRLFLGGGGGSGHEDNDNTAYGGGSGGGLIYILSYGTVGGNGSIISNGQNGGNDNSIAGGPPNWDGDGTGGAGGGGTIVLQSAGTISVASVYANGGSGGNQYVSDPGEAQGGGGGGGGGYIALSNAGVTTQVNGGANGVTDASPMATFPPNGATEGGNGTVSTTAPIACSPQLSGITGPVNVCEGQTYTYSVIGGCPATTYMWTLPAGWSGTSTTNTITVTVGATSGTIDVSACPLDTNLVVVVSPSPTAPKWPVDTAICGPINFTLNAGSTTFNYLWSTGATTPTITVTDTGKYKILVYTDCDTVSDSTVVFGGQLPKIALGADTAVCTFTNYILKLKVDSFAISYLWSTGAMADSIPVFATGTYKVTASNTCGSVTDSIIISGCAGDYVVPNAFIPGKSGGINSVIGLIPTGSGKAKLLVFSIFNRWGQIVFTTNDETAKWDGTYNGSPEPIGVFVYYVSYIDAFGVTKLLKGNITLLR